MKFTDKQLFWVHEPEKYKIESDSVEIVTQPYTDLWQRTYYGFCNDNAPLLLLKSKEKYFSFTIKTEFESKVRFDQCGVAVYQNSENWIKASIEYENQSYQRLGSVVTNDGYSDWATTDISADIHSMWYRLSRRESDFCIEYSTDGLRYKQMRICRLRHGGQEISFGVYACSPENSSFIARFTEMEVGECQWKEHK